VTRAYPVMPGVPAAGHYAGGFWHPGSADRCTRGACAPPVVLCPHGVHPSRHCIRCEKES
jgi:hypothetical protein